MNLSYKERLYTQLIESNSGSKTIFGTLATQWDTKCQDLGDAVYISEDTYHMYVPENIEANAKVVTYYPGAGGSGNDAQALRNYISENHPNDIVLIVKSCSTDYEKANRYYLDIANQVVSEKNIKVSNYDFYGFSAGERAAYHGTLQAIKDNPSLGPQTSVIIDGAYNNDRVVFTDEEINLLKNNGSKFLFFESSRDNGGVSSDNVEDLAKQGIPVVVAQINDVDHPEVNNFVFNNKVMDYFNGKTSTFSNSDQVSYYTYDLNKGEFVDITREEALSIVNSNARVSYTEELSLPENIDYSEITNQYGYLKSLAFIPTDVLNNPNLTSDESFIVNHVDTITSLITSSAFLQGIKNNNFSSTSNIPMQEDVCIKAFYLQTGQLLDALSKEIKNVLQISEIIKETDQNLADQALDQTVVEDAATAMNTAGVAGATINMPNNEPSGAPKPVETPTQKPNVTPAQKPNVTPTQEPSITPAQEPSITPAQEPNITPTQEPNVTPTQEPSITPTQEPSITPTQEPNVTPTQEPNVTPTQEPSVTPTQKPSVTPTQEPSIAPTPDKESILSKGVKVIGGIGATAATIAGGIFGIKKHAEKKNRIDEEPEDEESDNDEI